MPNGMNSSDVEDIIDNLYEQSIINKCASDPTRKSIHVSDLTSDCMRKAWYRLNDHAIDLRDFKKSLPLVHGTALHEVCNLGGLEHELSMFCNVKTGKIKTDNDSLFDCVKGSMDDLVEIDGELFICDKKTTKKSIPKEAPDTYKTQMNIYKLLYYITTGVEIERACIVYIDKSSAWERHKTRCFDLLPLDEIRKFVVDKLVQLDTKVAPAKVPTYLCPWCSYVTECNPQGYGRF
jgi:CRISPR/Cas system-associated exonuclease Cas4 (RecB family)